MDRSIVKFLFKQPVHFGDGRLYSSNYTFDAATLFSALFIEALRLGSSCELLNAAKNGALLISDAFPFIGDTFYLPKPMLPPGFFPAEGYEAPDVFDSVAAKELKRMNYIPTRDFGDYLAGSLDPFLVLESFLLGSSTTRTNVNLTYVNKNEAEPYQVGSFSFYKDTGLYIILQGEYDITPLLEQLQFSGIGGERSSGYGRFEYLVSDEDPIKGIEAIRTVENDDRCHILLSSAAPTQEETTGELLMDSRYHLVRKGGFIQSQTYAKTFQKKRDVYVFTPGSVFKKEFFGEVIDVDAAKGSHPVYRYARAMWLVV